VDPSISPLDEFRAMGMRGHALVASRYVWPLVAERMVALYRWLLRDGERPAFVAVD